MEIAKVEYLGFEDVYDLHIDDKDHSFYCQDIPVHYSGECRVLDGRRYFTKFDSIPSHLRPPIHASCRSSLIPRTTFDAQDRTSSSGIIPSEKYPTFFKKQDKAFQIKVLGKKKYELYKKGQYKMVSLVDAIGSRKIDIKNYKESLISLTKGD